MKKISLLFLAFVLATQVLFAGFSAGNCGNNCKPEPAATLVGVNGAEKIDYIYRGNGTGNVTQYAPGPKKLYESSLYRLEFDAENGITLMGGNVADLLFCTNRLPLDLAIYEQLPNSHIEVLVNEQPMAIQATNLTTALRQVPAEQIKAIEISTDFLDNANAAAGAEILIRVTQIK